MELVAVGNGKGNWREKRKEVMLKSKYQYSIPFCVCSIVCSLFSGLDLGWMPSRPGRFRRLV